MKLYLPWIAACAILFVALRGAEDPSRRHGRILSNDAGLRAVQILRKTDPVKYRGYDVVHIAWAGRGEGDSRNRWIVLCDREPRTALHEAVVVEIDGADGALLVIRNPE